MITKDNITSHELIGLQTEIVKSTNKQILGLRGKIVDESKFMFTILTKNGIKRLPKDSSSWKFEFNGQKTELDGSALTRRSYERMGVKA